MVGSHACESMGRGRIVLDADGKLIFLPSGALSRVGSESKAGWRVGGNDGVYSSSCLVWL